MSVLIFTLGNYGDLRHFLLPAPGNISEFSSTRSPWSPSPHPALSRTFGRCGATALLSVRPATITCVAYLF